MLSWIRVRNIAVIDELEIDFERGLNLLTGETGAGKSILVDALGLALGSRATTDLLRSGAEVAQVEAIFQFESLPEKLVRLLEDAGIECEDDELVIRREISVSGRGKVAVNGSAGAISLLRHIAPYLADIYGQGEHSSLLHSGAELELLDRLGGNEQKRNEVGESYRRLLELDKRLERLEHDRRDRESRRELLEFQLHEIEKAAIRSGEDEELEEEKKLLVHEERLRGAAEEAYAVLYDEESSVLSRLDRVWKRVSELAAIDSRMAPFLTSQPAVTSQLEDLALFLRDYRERIRFTPGRLDEVEDRLALLERLKKKYGGSLDAVMAHQQRCKDGLDRLENEDEQLEETKDAIDRAARDYSRAAGELSKQRQTTARKLEKRVQTELRSLAMEKARFAIEVSQAGDSDESRTGWKETGLDDVQFLFSANPGEELRLLSRIASGGESSRFMLSLKSVATAGEQSKTLVFDEVDTGIEGRVADVVGEKLKQLAKSHQVICITHLPQIASYADVHYRIEKTVSRGRTTTGIERLDYRGRIQEIARMLAGAAVTESALRHAEQLVTGKT